MAAPVSAVEPAVPVRTKAPRYFQIACTSCKEINNIDRAMFIGCPVCSAMPGSPCVDMRSKVKGTIVPLAKIHPARVSALSK